MILNRIFRRQSEPDVNIEEGLKKTRRGIFAEITALFDRSSIDEELFEDLEALLIQADVGVETTVEIVEALRDDIATNRIIDPTDAKLLLRDQMVKLLADATRNRKVKIYKRGTPFVTLVVGVNGTGKTTSIAKLAHFHQQRGRNVLLAAGDTFRAAAIDQLKVWGERVNAPVIAHGPNADPGAVVFDGAEGRLCAQRRYPLGRYRRALAHEVQPHGGADQDQACDAAARRGSAAGSLAGQTCWQPISVKPMVWNGCTSSLRSLCSRPGAIFSPRG